MRKRKINKGILLKRVALLGAAVIVVCVFVNQYQKLRGYNEQISQLEQDIAAQLETGQELSEKENLYSSMQYIEKIARGTLGLVRADEKVYIDSSQQ